MSRDRAVVLVVAVLALASVAQTAVLDVPDDYGTIQAAIDAAQDGDEVAIAQGTYRECIRFNGKAITVRSHDPGDPAVVNATVIDGMRNGSVVSFVRGEGPASVLAGLTVTNGSGTGHWNNASGGGIYILDASPTIDRCRIADNEIVAPGKWTDGGGIAIWSYGRASSPTIRDCVIEGNAARGDGGGGGICVYSINVCGQPLIEGNIVRGCQAKNGGGIETDAPATIRGNLVCGNQALSLAGGIMMWPAAEGTVEQNRIQDNEANWQGGGLYCWNVSPTIRNNIIAHNSAGNAGGGIYCDRSAAEIVGDTIVANSARFGGGVLGYKSPAVVKNTIVASAVLGGGIYHIGADDAPRVSFSDVFANAGGDFIGFSPTEPGNISGDPLFANPAGGDYHLQSFAGRWNPATSGWVRDSSHSPCIDAGDPTSDCSAEPEPNAGRINLGAYGGTAEASKSSPALAWAGAGGYVNDGVEPDSGDPHATRFIWKVIYRAPDGRPPSAAELHIQRLTGDGWQSASVLAMVPGRGDPRVGQVFRTACRLPNAVYRYRFRFTVGGAEVPGQPAAWHDGPRIVGPPILCWYGGSGFESDGVEPNVAPPGARLTFRVKYLDSAGDAPTEVVVRIERNGRVCMQRPMQPGPGEDYRLGRAYRVSLRLGRPGTYRYKFQAADQTGRAVGAPTRWMDGPTIETTSQTAAISSLVAAPTHAGAQITFVTSAAAEVQARILNPAGRPVRTLCQAKPCGAGTNTLIWNAQSDRGLLVPNGTYFVEIEARSPDGKQARAVATVTINR